MTCPVAITNAANVSYTHHMSMNEKMAWMYRLAEQNK